LAKDTLTVKEMSTYLNGENPMTPAQQLSFERAYAKVAKAGN